MLRFKKIVSKNENSVYFKLSKPIAEEIQVNLVKIVYLLSNIFHHYHHQGTPCDNPIYLQGSVYPRLSLSISIVVNRSSYLNSIETNFWTLSNLLNWTWHYDRIFCITFFPSGNASSLETVNTQNMTLFEIVLIIYC